MEQRVIISRLLDKYESSKHLLEPGTSSRRVMLRIDKKELPEYRYDESSAIRDAYNNAARSLEKDGVISIEWARENRMSVIILNLSSIEKAYCMCERQHPREKAKAVINELNKHLDSVSCDWIVCWKQDVRQAAAMTYKIPVFCKDNPTLLIKLATAFRVYDSLKGVPISMRAFSIECFNDSKTFERECRDEFLRIAQKYNSELNDVCQQQDLSQREKLAFLGIYARPEMYELCGNCRIKTSDGVVDLSSAGSFGLGFPSSMVDSIIGFDLINIKRITFIENKTSYDEYLLSEKASDELVIYHGGFLSPQKKKLYEKLAGSACGALPVSFWADIDIGGFRMFENLADIFPTLTPMRMGAEDVAKYHSSGLKRENIYLNRLRQCRGENKYPQFSNAIEEMLKYGVTIEQEAFLINSK